MWMREIGWKDTLSSVKCWGWYKSAMVIRAQDLADFIWLFFRKCWEILKEDIMEAFKEFHRGGKFE